MDAELSGMAIATGFANFGQNDIPVVIRPDLALSSKFTQCLAASKQDHALVTVLQALSHAVGTRVAVKEVRAHQGDPWNELADKKAKHAAHTGRGCGCVPWESLHKLAISDNDLKWGWLGKAHGSIRGAYPTLFDNTVRQPAESNLSIRANVDQTQLPRSDYQVDLRIAIYNALALADDDQADGSSGARSLRLDQILLSLGFKKPK